VVLCVHEESRFEALNRPRPTLPMTAGISDRRTHDHARYGITSLFAAFDVADGSGISKLHRRHRAIEFKKFLVAIDKAVPADLDIHLVCDNYAPYNTAEIKAWLGGRARFHVRFAPTSSSWTNQVERWFGLSAGKHTHRGVHSSVKALEDDIAAWMDTWHKNPRPFTWAKTADETLRLRGDRLTRAGTDNHGPEENQPSGTPVHHTG
jgi:hypothetical protein